MFLNSSVLLSTLSLSIWYLPFKWNSSADDVTAALDGTSVSSLHNQDVNSSTPLITLLLFSKASFKWTFCFFAPNTTFFHFPINISTCNRSSSAKFGSALFSSFCDVLSMLLTFGCSVSTSSWRAFDCSSCASIISISPIGRSSSSCKKASTSCSHEFKPSISSRNWWSNSMSFCNFFCRSSRITGMSLQRALRSCSSSFSRWLWVSEPALCISSWPVVLT